MSSRVLLGCAAATLIVSGCGTDAGDAGNRRGSRSQSTASAVPATEGIASPVEVKSPPPVTVIKGTQKDAQAALDGASRIFRDDPTAMYEVFWHVGDPQQQVRITKGEFDLEAPAVMQTSTVDGASLAIRQTAGHIWSKVTGEGVNPVVSTCWMHLTTGTGDVGRASALSPAALLLVEPTARGFRAGTGNEGVVVDVLLDEAAPAMAPKIVSQLGQQINPIATVPAVITVREGQFSSIEMRASDVFDALPAAALTAEMAPYRDHLEGLLMRIEYSGFGFPVDVTPPGAPEVIELGDRAAFVANPPDDSAIEPCANAR